MKGGNPMNRSALKQLAVCGSEILVRDIRPLVMSQEQAERYAQLWFMRIAALRFLEANGWLPDGERLFTDGADHLLPPSAEPQLHSSILRCCELLGKVPALEGLFAQDAAAVLPQTLLATGGVVQEMYARIPTAEWIGFPEILGWLYQYLNTQERERAFAQVRCRGKIAPQQIPAATQMFTPDWIVRYMTQNTLHALTGEMPKNWSYLIPEASQPPEAAAACKAQQKPLMGKPLAALTIIDPCMGTGHILAYVFDALMELYLQEGFAPQDAVRNILENNLFGLDIDENACALAAFVLLMKARQYDGDILQRDLQLQLHHFAGLDMQEEFTEMEAAFAAQFIDAQVYGSLLRPQPAENGFSGNSELLQRMQTLCTVLGQQYDAVITNPPYMGSSNMPSQLSAFVRKHYPDSKSDLFAAFIERCAALTAPHGCFAMITQHAWMFLSSYAKLRKKLQAYTMRNMVHLGARAFSQTDVGTIVQTTAFVCMGGHIPDYRTTYLRLTEDEDKERAFFKENRRHICDIGRFSGISGSPLCYWITDAMRRTLTHPKLSSLCTICQGMTTSDNKRFLRLWHEVSPGSIVFDCENAEAAMKTGKRWFPYNKGGKLRRWYGNNSHVVDFYKNGEEMREFHAQLNKAHSGGRIKNEAMYFKQALTWPFITESTKFGVRFQPQGFLFDVSGSSLFPDESQKLYLMGFLSSRVALEMLALFNPTMNFQVENIGSLPIIIDHTQKAEVERLVSENIAIAREEWDSYEQSWDFTCHPLIRKGVARISEAFALWEEECEKRLRTMQANERRINEIFLQIYGLTQEFSPDVSRGEITLRSADCSTDVRSFVSFAVGCMFGRYTVEHADFTPLSENFLPVFEGCGRDAVSYLEEFLESVCGVQTLEENLEFLAQAIGGTGTPREILRRYFCKEFYADHCKIYRKRPIYWMADSGRRQAMRGLVYLHRMDAETLSLLERKASECIPPPTAETELHEFRQRLADLQKSGVQLIADDGVLKNYEKFCTVFAPIRQ